MDKALIYSPDQTNAYSEIVWSKIVKIFQPNIFNLNLTPKFLKLAFQFVGAYCNFIKQTIPAEFKKENADQNALIKIVTDLNALGGKLKAEFPGLVAEALKVFLILIRDSLYHFLFNREKEKQWTLAQVKRLNGRDCNKWSLIY